MGLGRSITHCITMPQSTLQRVFSMSPYFHIILGTCLVIGCSNSLSKDASIDTAETDTDDSPVPTYECGDSAVYTPFPIGQWKICQANQLTLNQPTLSQNTITQLTSDLAHIETLLDPDLIAILQSVYIWIEEDIPAFPGAVYHPSADWLSNNGYPEYWAQSVQIGNATDYISWTSIQPAMILHELAHAWHHQVLGYGNTEIGNAYASAVASGIYDSVEYAGGGVQPAYGLYNEQEFFAELTEAYFWENDFYPFTNAQLMTFDPQGYQMIQNAWVVPD